jgi:2-phospho-L-lactate/phosphoenolpyruvate guanylyltransferase
MYCPARLALAPLASAAPATPGNLTTLRRVPAIVIPYRGDAKRRVSSPLRAAVAVAMLGDVVEAALAVGRVLVVTDDPAVVPPTAELVADPGQGLGAAVAAGLSLVDGHALVVNADLPAATPAAVRRLEGFGLALVEARDGTTNALSLPDPSVFAPLYGPGSADRFRSHAAFANAPIPELELDVDSDADLERLSGLLGRRTRALLAVPA